MLQKFIQKIFIIDHKKKPQKNKSNFKEPQRKIKTEKFLKKMKHGKAEEKN